MRTNSDGSVLRLRDVARVELGAQNLDRDTKLNGAPAALIPIYQSPGANAVVTLDTVKQQIAELARDFPEDLAWKVTYDTTTFVTDTIHEVLKTMVEAFVLVVLVVYLFLGSLRATLIPTLAVPVSLIGAFIVLNAIGYSANSVSLLAVVLAVGIVVDDAIVVVEAVEHEMEADPSLSPTVATKQAMAKITAPVIAITLVLLSVFVPIGFISGISGELFRQFAVTVAVSMLLSAVNALTLSPALCAMLLRPHHGPRRGPIGYVMRGIDQVRDAYGAVVARMVRISIISIPLVILAAFGVVALGKITPTGFLPQDDQGAFFTIMQLPDGASIGRTEDVVKQVEAILEKEEAVADYIVDHRPELPGQHAQPNAAFVIVTLKPFDERKSASQGADAVIARLGQQFRGLKGGMALPVAPPPIIGLGTGGGFTYVLQDIRGADPKAMAQVLRGLLIAANQDPRLSRVFSTFSATNPSIYLDIDRDKAQVLGVSLSTIFQTLQANLGGAYVNDMNLFGRTWQVQVQAEAKDRASVDDIYRLNVRSDAGKMVPMRSLAEVKLVLGPQAITRYNNRRAVTDPGVTRGGRFLGHGACRHGRGRRPDAAVRLSRRLDRHGVPGEAVRGPDRHHSRLCGAVRLPVPGRAL